jgi:hypothetical protein
MATIRASAKKTRLRFVKIERPGNGDTKPKCFSAAGSVFPLRSLVAGFAIKDGKKPKTFYGRTVEYGKGRWTIDFGPLDDGDYTMYVMISDGSALSKPRKFTVRHRFVGPPTINPIQSPQPVGGFSIGGTRDPNRPVSSWLMSPKNMSIPGQTDPTITGAQWGANIPGPMKADTCEIYAFYPDNGSSAPPVSVTVS